MPRGRVEVQLYCFFNLCDIWGGSSMLSATVPSGKKHGVQEAGWAPRLVSDGRERSRAHRDMVPGQPRCSYAMPVHCM